MCYSTYFVFLLAEVITWLIHVIYWTSHSYIVMFYLTFCNITTITFPLYLPTVVLLTSGKHRRNLEDTCVTIVPLGRETRYNTPELEVCPHETNLQNISQKDCKHQWDCSREGNCRLLVDLKTLHALSSFIWRHWGTCVVSFSPPRKLWYTRNLQHISMGARHHM